MDGLAQSFPHSSKGLAKLKVAELKGLCVSLGLVAKVSFELHDDAISLSKNPLE
jgi:hypothetical protein